MKHYLDLIPLSARIHSRQSRMTRICIILAVFLVSVMFGLADMYLQGALQKEMQESGNWHYQLSGVDADTASLIAARPEVKASGWHSVLPVDAGYMLNGLDTAISGQNEEVFHDLYLCRLSEGTYPQTFSELALSPALAESLSLEPGDTAVLSRPDGSSLSFTVTGILETGGLSRLTPGTEQSIVLSGEGMSFLLSGQEPAEQVFVLRFSLLCRIPDVIADIQARNGISDEQLFAHESLLSIEGQLPGTSISQIYQIALLLSLLVMLTCVLMISSSLNSSIARRTEFFGLLRCLGASRKQILRFVRREALYWCRLAMPVGIFLSVLAVWALCAAMRAISPQWFAYMPLFGISLPGIFSGILLGLATVLLAARSPARLAAKASPLEAASGNTHQPASFRRNADTRFFRIETALGIHHAVAGKKNYILMTGAFAVCICLFLAFSTLVGFMENAMMPKAWTPELSIASETNTCSISPELFDSVSASEAVKRAYGRMFAYDVPAEAGGITYGSNLISYEENQFRWAEDSLIAGSIEDAAEKPGQILYVANTGSDIALGDAIILSVSGETHTVTVAGILSDSPLAREEGKETFLCSEATFTELTGETGYTIIDVQFHEGASEADVASIEALFDGGVQFSDHLLMVQQQRNLYRAFAVLVYGFLSIITAITVFHIMNTIHMGVSAKLRPYGIMRAAGMSGRQLVKMLLAEAGTYALSGIFWGCVLGLPLHWMIFSSLITNFWGIPWRLPVFPLGLIVCVILLTTALAVRSPAKWLCTMSIVDNISTQ